MEPVDVAARLDALDKLLNDLDQGNEGARTYAAVKEICRELNVHAEELERPRNEYAYINEKLGLIEEHAAALSGLYPSWNLERGIHESSYRVALSTLRSSQCFAVRY